MATSSIYHFSHKLEHPLIPVESEKEFLCDGCKTPGAGKRYRCNAGCDFDLHDYCGTCPPILTSFMHPHNSLTLMIHNPLQSHRFCDVCRDPIEGLFYTCRECGFDLHPVCTQLPQKLNHALHMTHPLLLQSNSSLQSFCSVCKNSCNGWRYGCSICNFDIHLECVLTPVVSRGFPVTGQGVPYQPPPQFAPYYGFQHHGPGFMNHGPGYNPYGQYGGPYMYPQQNSFVQPQQQPQNYYNYQEGQYGVPYMYPQQNCFVQSQPQNYYNYDQEGASDINNGVKTCRLGKFMFYLVGRLGLEVNVGGVNNRTFILILYIDKSDSAYVAKPRQSAQSSIQPDYFVLKSCTHIKSYLS